MPKHNFSTEQSQVYDLMLDLARGEFSTEGGVTKKDLENHLRDMINKDMLGGKTYYQALRRNAITLFEVVEEIFNTAIGEDVLNSPFVESFVEVKNRALGDKTAWYSEGGMLQVASFAGNHWDTNRQQLDLGSEFTLKSEWIYIHVYEDLERFLLNIIPLEKLLDKLYLAVNKYMKERIHAQFANVMDAVPAEFSATGNDVTGLGNLCDLVQTYGGYSQLTLAGTKAGLRKLTGMVPENQFANSHKEARMSTGFVPEWDGHKLMEIPQALKPGTFEFALDDSKIFIMGADVKPIKLEIIGDTRTVNFDTTGHQNNDMSMDFQIQSKFGMGLLLPEAFGCYTLV